QIVVVEIEPRGRANAERAGLQVMSATVHAGAGGAGELQHGKVLRGFKDDGSATGSVDAQRGVCPDGVGVEGEGAGVDVERIGAAIEAGAAAGDWVAIDEIEHERVIAAGAGERDRVVNTIRPDARRRAGGWSVDEQFGRAGGVFAKRVLIVPSSPGVIRLAPL